MEATRRYSNFPEVLRTPVTSRIRDAGTSARGGKTGSHRVYKVAQRLDPETILKLVSDYEDGTPTTQLTERYKLGKGTVLKLLQANGAKLRRQRLTPEQIVEARRLYLAGLSAARIGKQLVLSADTVRLALIRAGTVMRGAHER